MKGFSNGTVLVMLVMALASFAPEARAHWKPLLLAWVLVALHYFFVNDGIFPKENRKAKDATDEKPRPPAK